MSTSTSTTGPAPSGRQVTMAYVGGGIGLVGMCQAPFQEAPCHLFRTADFEHFFDVTPPAALSGGGLLGAPGFVQASFLTPEVGWVSTFHGGSATVAIYRTTDGGAEWDTVQGTEHTESAGAVTYLQFLSPTTGYLDTLQPSAPSAELEITTDGGVSWKPVLSPNPNGPSSLPVAHVVFVSAEDAIATDDDPGGCIHSGGSDVWVSADGGVDWHAVALPSGAAPTPQISVCPGPPTPTPAGEVMSADLVGPTTVRVVFLTSTDHGDSWQLTPGPPTTFSPSVGSNGFPPSAEPSGAVAGDGSWWILGESSSGGYSVATSADRGSSWSTEVPTGLPASGALQTVVPIDRLRAWATVESGPNVLLFATSDGGDAWTNVTP